MSGGERGRIICREQVEDILNAVTFLTTIPSVDATRIGLIGYSLGGGNVTYASGIDDRVSFTVSVAGIGDGERWLKWCYKTFRSEVEWRNLLDRLMKDRVSRVLTGRSEYVDAMEVQPLSEDVKRLIEDIRRRFPPPRGPVVKIPLQTGESIIFFRPEEQAKKIAPRPILWIHGDTDDVVSVEESRSMYSESDKSGELIIIPDADHFMLGDVAKPMFDHLVGLIVKWIGEKVSKKS